MVAKAIVQELTHLQKVRRLYKTVLQLHKGLPSEIKSLGDQYAKEEFRRHKKCTPKETEIFMNEWSRYAVTLAQQLGLRGKSEDKLGNPIEEQVLEFMRDDQIVQLYELMRVAKNEIPPEEQKNVPATLDQNQKK